MFEINPIIPFILILIIIILLNSLPKVGMLVSNIFILTFFMFVIPNIDPKLGVFYALMCLANIIFSLFPFGIKDLQVMYGYKGIVLSVVSVLLGIGIFIIMIMFQSKTEAAILGVPKLLSITGLSTLLGVAQISVLGFAENRFFLNLQSVIMMYIMPVLLGIVGPFALILPFFAVAGIFSIFHLSAYALSIGSLLWAFFIFLFWSFTAYGLKLGEEPGSIAHYLWNGTRVIARQYASITGGV